MNTEAVIIAIIGMVSGGLGTGVGYLLSARRLKNEEATVIDAAQDAVVKSALSLLKPLEERISSLEQENKKLIEAREVTAIEAERENSVLRHRIAKLEARLGTGNLPTPPAHVIP